MTRKIYIFAFSSLVVLASLAYLSNVYFLPGDDLFTQEGGTQYIKKTSDTPTEDEFTDLTDRRQVKVSLEENRFKPRAIRIKKGTEIFWENMDPVSHGMIFDNLSEKRSDELAYKGIFKMIINDSGLHTYKCFIHPGEMAGFIQ